MLSLAIIASSLVAGTAVAAEQVNVYSARKEALIKPLLERFTEQTGIEVNLITGDADALLQRIKVEGRFSRADVFVTVDAGRLQRAKEAGILQPFDSEYLLATIPAELKDSERYWYGLSQRSRTIIYNKAKVDPSEFSTYEALAESQFKSRLCIRSSDNIYNQSLVASMIDAKGHEFTQTWAKGLVANMARPPAGGDTEQLYAVAEGVCDATLANTYYLGRLLNSDNAKDVEIGKQLGVFWPNQGADDRGIHMNVSGAGITTSSKNKANAIKLIEFMANLDSQAWYAEVNNEYPVVPAAKISATLASFGSFKTDDLPLNVLGENNRQAVEIMDHAGWK